MKVAVRILVLAIMMTSALLAQQRDDRPPELVWDKIEGNCPASLSWTSLQGNLVILSLGIEDVFPQDISEWNQVPQAFEGKPVIFVQVVSGSEFLLDQALAKTAYQGCILLDKNRSNRNNDAGKRNRDGSVFNPAATEAGEIEERR